MEFCLNEASVMEPCIIAIIQGSMHQSSTMVCLRQLESDAPFHRVREYAPNTAPCHDICQFTHVTCTARARACDPTVPADIVALGRVTAGTVTRPSLPRY